MSPAPFPRRDFVQSVWAASMFSIVPRHVLGRGYRAPSDTVNLGCIGVGGMGRSDVRGMAEAGANIVALCDVDDVGAADAFRSHPDARRYRDFRRLIDESGDLDALTVTTPDHLHAVITMAGLRAGKHVYTQKPLVRTLAEVRAIRDAAAARPSLVTQMGNQGHAGDGVRVMREWVEAGLIGPVREIHMWTNRPIWPQGIDRPTDLHVPRPTFDWDLWLGPAHDRPYNPAYAPFRWRGWWDFGTGALGDMACHIMDAAYWILNLGYPSRVEAECTRLFQETAPSSSRVTFSFPMRNGRPEVKVVWRDGGFAPARPAEWSSAELWPHSWEGGQLWLGDDGKMLASTYAQDPRLLDTEKMRAVTEQPVTQRYARSKGVHAEWLDAITAGSRAGSDFTGHAAGLTEMVLLGCLAQRMGSVIELNPQTGALLTDVPQEFVSPAYRAGWSL